MKHEDRSNDPGSHISPASKDQPAERIRQDSKEGRSAADADHDTMSEEDQRAARLDIDPSVLRDWDHELDTARSVIASATDEVAYANAMKSGADIVRDWLRTRASTTRE